MLFVSSIAISLLLAEIGIRLFLPQKLITDYSSIWRPDSLFGWRHRENVATHINSGEGMVRFVTDAEGFRVNAPGQVADRDIAEGGVSILFIGDSFLEAIQVENESTIPQVVGARLRELHPGVQIRITNSSVGGWNPNHYRLEAKRLAVRQYDLAVIALYVANDVISTKEDRFQAKQVHVHRLRFPKAISFAEIRDALLYPFNETCERYSHLYVFVKNRTRWFRMRVGLAPDRFPDVFATSTRSSKRWKTTTEVCESINEEFGRHGTPCRFLLIPASYQTDAEIFRSYVGSLDVDTASVDVNQPNRILHDSFAGRSLSLIDPLEHMRQLAATGVELYGRIDSHLNAAGHRVVADYITAEIGPQMGEIMNKASNE